MVLPNLRKVHVTMYFVQHLIQFQNTAKANGANAVTNLVSFYKSNETRSTTTYQCAKGTALAGVALKGDLVKF
jgi:hypothetical protein